MKKVSLLCFVVLGCVLILGAGYIQKSSDLPGDSTTGNNLTEVVGGAYGICQTNGTTCQGNRVCIPEQQYPSTDSTCTSGTGGSTCGTCNGSEENKTCQNTPETATTPCNESTTSCCDVSGECHSTGNSARPCECVSGTTTAIGIRLQCSN
jgi:hypothetical protein